MKSALDQLRDLSMIVADTGDPGEILTYRPQDCTTNPSLVLAAARNPAMQPLIRSEVDVGKALGLDAATICDRLTVAIGAQLAGLVPGRISTEVEAHLSFDIEMSVRRAHGIIDDYARRGIGTDRILIKLAATWEGIRAAELLEKEGVQCNLTLLFSTVQARACADAGVYLISPFVGRITDWFKKLDGVNSYTVEDDPGVRSVKEIYALYKKTGVRTIVMGASFRNIDQIKALAGCDRLTISPTLLSELSQDFGRVERQLSKPDETAESMIPFDESTFRRDLNQNAMANEKLSEGIRAFHSDYLRLVTYVSSQM